MVKKLSISLLLLLLIQSVSFARNTGCQLSNNLIYTNQILLSLGKPSFNGTSPVALGPSDCTTTNSGSGSCQVCFGNLLGLVCLTGFQQGSLVNYAFNCDLDSPELILVILGGISGFFFLCKKPN
ncbi:hypothetical protein SAMN04489864_11425 [Pedobacter insulae]|uniref:PEP-CTERM protein-sorting domain-containing protein n=1 Tax=Pedobacter insulae TaxID=414048 RepID=A0A1I3ADA6_9SPHI|nr:hypothetical protein SAMN04489864_11425 [Pedobacter insulae]